MIFVTYNNSLNRNRTTLTLDSIQIQIEWLEIPPAAVVVNIHLVRSPRVICRAPSGAITEPNTKQSGQ